MLNALIQHEYKLCYWKCQHWIIYKKYICAKKNISFTVLKEKDLYWDLLTCSCCSAACFEDVTDYMQWEGAEVAAFPSHLKLGSRIYNEEELELKMIFK